jgi:hypothetical protein
VTQWGRVKATGNCARASKEGKRESRGPFLPQESLPQPQKPDRNLRAVGLFGQLIDFVVGAMPRDPVSCPDERIAQPAHPDNDGAPARKVLRPVMPGGGRGIAGELFLRAIGDQPFLGDQVHEHADSKRAAAEPEDVDLVALLPVPARELEIEDIALETDAEGSPDGGEIFVGRGTDAVIVSGNLTNCRLIERLEQAPYVCLLCLG